MRRKVAEQDFFSSSITPSLEGYFATSGRSNCCVPMEQLLRPDAANQPSGVLEVDSHLCTHSDGAV